MFQHLESVAYIGCLNEHTYKIKKMIVAGRMIACLGKICKHMAVATMQKGEKCLTQRRKDAKLRAGLEPRIPRIPRIEADTIAAATSRCISLQVMHPPCSRRAGFAAKETAVRADSAVKNRGYDSQQVNPRDPSASLRLCASALIWPAARLPGILHAACCILHSPLSRVACHCSPGEWRGQCGLW
jgi:hypothetical protein